jgi:hypothetical protein
MKHEYMKQKTKADHRNALREEWTARLTERLVGLTITKVSYTGDEDMEMCGWHQAGVQLHLDDGTVMIVQQDDEGNAPGSLAIYHQDKKQTEYAPTI